MRKLKEIKIPPTLDATEEAATRQQIQEKAYFNWINRGRVHGDDTNDWLEAEQQMVDSLRAKRI